MSIPKYGRATPLQMDMLGLGGEICRWFHQRAPTDEERMSAMRASRKVLCRMTGLDRGYDLQAWHTELESDRKHSPEYMHPYAWGVVRPRILQLIADPDRFRLVELIERSERSQGK
ncbi:MAG TPA: hypothetical protein VFE47_11890 [Tepidisphaeraceae bacterium]|jgi:hypothetical protein|nr:hypothetical protein [Tepidisphaeraceae bacterium]